jgi:peptidyl-prolyl cis-trans isomerase SurA
MGRHSLIAFSFICLAVASAAQTVATYGPYKIEARDFLRAYQRNQGDSVKRTEASLRAYLDLYINAKLKIREAYARRYDTLPLIVQEVENLRAQLIDKYLADPVLLERLKKEAFQRSQTDRSVAHLFISFKNPSGVIDTLRSDQRKREVERKLTAGQDFFNLAVAYSDDPTVEKNQGRIGFLTAFSLPYEMETAVYATPVGGNSQWVRSGIGYHLFRVLSERPAVGNIRAKQILLALSTDADPTEESRAARLADSLYNEIKKGASFSELARLYSTDYVSAANGGALTDFGVGQYEPLFEEQVIALKSDQEVSAPFRTTHGWHLVQRLSITKPGADFNDPETQQLLDQRVRLDDRWRNSKDFIYTQVQKKIGTRRAGYDDSALWAYSDSVLDRKPMASVGKKMQANSTLFTIGKETLGKELYTVADWIHFATNFRFRPDGIGLKPWQQVRNEWEQYLMVEYYKKNLALFNEEYSDQLAEFQDGNLFFEIMQQEIWNKAQSDTVAQRKLFDRQKQQYNWGPSADVVLFFCSDVNAAKELQARLQAKPSNWMNESLSFGERVFYDETRLEWNQIPGLGNQVPKGGLLLDPVINQTDNNATLAYVLRVYEKPAPKSFEDARGNVVSDLQGVMDKKWEASLRKKYPVKVNEKVLTGLVK